MTHYNFKIEFTSEHPFLGKNINAKLTKTTFNLSTGTCSIVDLIDDMSFEFPIVNQKYIGYKNRYAYLATWSMELPKD